MSVRIILSRPMKIPAPGDGSAGEGPRHSMRMLASDTRAAFHAPRAGAGSMGDRVRALCLPEAEHWALGRQLRGEVQSSDRLLCTGEIPGFHVAAALGGRRNSPHIAVMVHNIIRPRTIAAIRLWRLDKRITRFLAVSAPQIDFLRRRFKLPADRAVLVPDHTDTTFFSPGVALPKSRPLIVSVGLEQRDYVTLAKATDGLDVEVKISGFSKDAHVKPGTFPVPFPPHMSARFYSWLELQQLYRDADVVVVSTFPSTYAAGVQGLMEGMASGRPVVVTGTTGLRGYIDDRAAISVPPQDVDGMRNAIRRVLDDPAAARAMGEAGRKIACERYSMEAYVAAMKSALA
ncbi:MAG: glycosyltransferase family 4 protein [Steroidobacteraceae bacterium]